MSTIKTEVSNDDEIIDMRDVFARFEELRDQDERDEEEDAEFDSLSSLIGECKGNGGDEQWQGDWYPGSLIRDSYFRTYAEELADDIGAIDRNASWPLSFIDWEAAADALKQDYTTVDFDGVEYWTR